jgi:CelD/BcsL family acetyltransferase involved in cellulose biosynthesis
MKVECIKEFEKFVQLRKQWNTLLFRSEQNSLFLTHQWFESWWQCFGRAYELEILTVVDEQDNIIGIAPLMAGDKNLYFMANHEVTDYCDFITLEDKTDDFFEIILDHFEQYYSHILSIELINIPAGSAALSSLPRFASKRSFSCEILESDVVPFLALPVSYDTYTQSLSRKNRHELRRKLRRMESLRQIRIQRITDPQELNTAIQGFIALHRESSFSKQEFWQKEGMSDFFRRLTHLFSLEKWVELNLLYSRDELIAGLLNFLYADSLYFYNMAYHKEFSFYSPGFFLFHRSIRQAMEEKKKVTNFLRGREKYKYSFGAKDSKIYNLTLSRSGKKSEDLHD